MEDQDLEKKVDAERQFVDKIVNHYMKEQRSTRRWRNFFKLSWLLIIGSLILLLYLDYFGVGKSTDQQLSRSDDHYALLSYKGVVDEDTVKAFLSVFKEAMSNDHAKAVIVKADSPGGSPVYSNVLYDEIKRMKVKYKKKIYVVVDELCASGCYYSFSQADEIYANRAATIGSIGAIDRSLNYSILLSKLGIENTTLTSGRLKAFGDPASPQTPEIMAYRQHMLDYIYKIFVDDVKAARGDRLKPNVDPDIFSGKVWVGQEAVDLGLIDGLMDVDQLVESITPENTKKLEVIEYKPPEDPVQKILDRIPRILVKMLDNWISSNF